MTSSPNSSGKNAEDILRQRDKVKITDQSEALFKQKWWFKTKTNDRVASRLEMAFKYELCTPHQKNSLKMVNNEKVFGAPRTTGSNVFVKVQQV